HPPAPPDPSRPKLNPLPPAPAHPDPPLLGPPNHVPLFVCLIGMAVGFLVLLIAPVVGCVVFVGFTISLGLIAATDNKRREMAAKAIEKAHQIECDRIDEEYATMCRPLKEANRRRMATWQAAKAAHDQAHAQACKVVDDRNDRQLAAFEAAEASAMAE